MTYKVFPFTVESRDTGHYIEHPWHYSKTFAKYKPKGLSWYAYDIEVLSKTRAKFTVYGMENFCYGGIGDVKHKFECDVDEGDLEEFIKRRIKSMAARQEQAEFDLRRSERVLEIMADISSSVSLS